MNDNAVNLRLKHLRKDIFKLSQVEFAKNIHISQPQYSLLEKSLRVLTERTFNDICREYNVNPVWLRSGEGEVFRVCTFDFHALTEQEQEFFLAYLSIPEKERLQLINFFNTLVEKLSKNKS